MLRRRIDLPRHISDSGRHKNDSPQLRQKKVVDGAEESKNGYMQESQEDAGWIEVSGLSDVDEEDKEDINILQNNI